MTSKKSIIQETNMGVYVWQLPDGKYLADEEGNFMLIQAKQGDQKRIEALKEAARGYGYPEGRAVFWPGRRPITDEEYEEQLARQRLGLVPDPLDVGSFLDETGQNRWVI